MERKNTFKVTFKPLPALLALESSKQRNDRIRPVQLIRKFGED